MIQVHAIGEASNGQIHDVAYIRLYDPLEILQRNNRIKLTTGQDYKKYKDSDVFFIERTWNDKITNEQTNTFIKYIKNTGKKFIYEIDDNLLDNKNLNVNQKNTIRLMARNADVIIVSTEELKRRMSVFNSQIVVIPNFLSTDYIGTRKNKFGSNKQIITIGYTGTFSHQPDFQMIKLPLMQILKKYEDKVVFEVVGALTDKETLRALPNARVIELGQKSRYDLYWKWMCDNNYWDIGIAPLKKNVFTICKSDIKFLDYAALGIAGIYSNHPAYSDTIIPNTNGILVQNTCEAWFQGLEKLITNVKLRNKIAKNAHKELYTNRLLEKNADRWWKAINTVMSGK
jgi:glycosyltransferase involved in cell wall biosynthesis